MKVPAKREQLGLLLPIIRAMSPPQKSVMATLVSTQVSGDAAANLEEVRARLSPANGTQDPMLTISLDVAKIMGAEEQSSGAEKPEELPEVCHFCFYSLVLSQGIGF